jgi:hypothetical protein
VLGFVFGFGGACAAIAAEWLYKQPFVMDAPWWKHLYLWLPLQLWIGYCIFRLVNMPGTNLLDAVIFFAFGSAVLRIIVATAVLHQTITIQTWVAFGLVLAATCVKTFWSAA